MLKKITAIILSVSILTMISFAENKKEYYVLVEATTGQTVTEENAFEKISIGALNKLMTLLLIAENVDSGQLSLTDELKAPSKVSEAQGATIWLLPNDKMSAEDLLKGLVIGSANDCAITFAYEIAGNEQKFVDMMNKRAAKLGMNNTLFKKCTTTDEGYSTAYDIALASRELLKHEWLISYMTTWMSDVRSGETMLVNNNELVRSFDGIKGILAGANGSSGFCISAAAERENKQYICVVCGCEEKDDAFAKAKKLLNLGFSNYSLFSPEINQEELQPVPVKKGTESEVEIMVEGSSEVVIPSGNEEEVKYELEIAEEITAPVEEGETVGRLIVSLQGKTVFESNVIACSSVPKLTLWVSFGRYLKSMFSL